MSLQWTPDRPGQGSMGDVTASAMALRSFVPTATDASAAVTQASATLATGWRAQSATTWATRGDALARSLSGLAQPVASVAAALDTYAAAVADIQTRERALLSEAASARASLHRAIVAQTAAVLASGPMSDSWWDARSAVRTAEAGVDTAEAQLTALAGSRAQADADAVAAITAATPADWTALHAGTGGWQLGAPGSGLALLLGGSLNAWRPDALAATSLRWMLNQMDDAEAAQYLEDNPAAAALVMTPTNLAKDPRFAAVAAAAAGPGGVDQVAAVSAAFAAMSAADRAALVRMHPWFVGNLDGAPFADRVEANKTAIRAALYQAGRDESRLLAERTKLEERMPKPGQPISGARGGWADYGTMRRYGEIATELAAAQALQEQYQELLTGKVDTFVDGRSRTITGHQVVLFDPEGSRFAEIVGSIDATSTNVGVLVGGTGTNLANADGMYDRALTFVEEARGKLAMITYQGGEMPQTLTQAVSSSYAHDIAPRLRDFVAGTNLETGAPVTVAGHSYGGSVVGAAEGAGMVADRILHIESAGAGPGVESSADYAAPDTPRYSMTAPGDPIAHIQGVEIGSWGHGADPDELDGVVQLETGRTNYHDTSSPLLQGLPSHSDVLKKDSTSWINMYNVFTGGEVMLYAEPRLVDSVWTPGGYVEEYELPMTDPSYVPPMADVP